MFQLSLTTYGQSLVSNTVSIDGLALSETYYSDLSSLENLSSVTIVLDDDAGGNFNGTALNLRVKDSSSNVYQASTILLYKIANGTKKVVAGFSQESAIVDKTEDSEVNLFISFDSSCFTNGFVLASIQASPVPAKINSDGLVHIENPDTSSDDTYSVYSKPQVDALLQDKQSALLAGEGISLANDVVKTTGIPFGIVDSTSTSTNFTVTVPGIYKLEDGVCCMVKNGVVTSASGFTLNVNGLGGKPCYSNLAAATRDTTLFNIAYTMLFVYDSTRVDGGCWICYRGYDSNTNTIGYQLRTNSTVMTVTDTARYYKLYFTSADGTQWVPASVNSKNDATTARAVNQRPINPFGRIVYTSANTNYTQGSNLAAATIWDQYVITLGYSFNVSGGTLALSVNTPVYLKCAPQTDGSAIIDDTTPVVQALPSTADGKIYIFLGVATSATQIELFIDKPVYYYDGTGIRLWTGVIVPTKTSQLTNDAGFITTETDPTVPSWAKQPSKPSYNLDEVIDGTNRKLSNYELKTNLKEGAYVDVDETTMTASSTNLPTGKAVASYVTGLGYITSASLPTVNNATLTIKKNSDDTGTTFTANASQDVTANLGLHTVATSGSYNDLSNKPTIPTVNNASLTITKGGTNDTTSKTFTANASSDVEIHLGLGAAADKAVDSTIAAASTSTNLPTSQAVASFVEGKNYLTSHQSLAAQVATAQYNSTDKTIEFYNAAGTKLNTDIDATAFIKDGMVDTVVIENSNLVISFNTDAGKEDIEIPISDIFDADNYYTKDDVDGLIPTVNNATLTIKKNASDTGTTFTANASQDVTANLGLHTVATSGSYNDLSDKPTIPTVNNATLTIQKNGTTVNTFTANASSNVTANITVPVDTGDLTNNAGFITLNDIGSSFVTIATDQTITGEKTFDAGGIIVTDGTDLTFEYTDSATPISTADNFAQIYTSSRTETDTTGDPITVPDLVINLSGADYIYAPTSDNAGVTQAKLSIRHGNTEVAYFGDNHFYSNSIGTSNNEVPTIYATDIYGELHGNATTATSAQSATSATSASYAANIGSSSSYTVATYVYNSNTDKALVPSVNASASNYVNLGSSNRKWHTLYLSDSISNGTYTYSLPSATGTLALTSQLPTVNNSTITIKKNSDDTGDSFTTNAASGKTINLGLATVATSGSYNDLSNTPSIPADITNSELIGGFVRYNVSGSGNLTISNTYGLFPYSGGTTTTLPAGTYLVRVRLRSTTASYSVTVNFGTPYTLTSSNGVIDDLRLVTLSSAQGFSASITTVAANTYLRVVLYEPGNTVTAVGPAAVTNDYNDLDNVPNGTLIIQKNGSNVASFSASADSNVTANITVPTNTNQLTNGAGFITASDISGKQDELTAGCGIAIDTTDDTISATGIPFGIVDGTSTSTAFTATVPGIDRLEDGVCCMLKNGVVTSAAGFTIDVNNLGAKPVYSNMAAETAETTMFNVNYTMLFVYDSTRVSGGCWILYRGYYQSDTDKNAYQIRLNTAVLPASDTSRYYKLFFTSADGTALVPASVNSSNNVTTARTPNQRPINPFGRIAYTSATTSYATGASVAAATLWDQYVFNLAYSYGPATPALTSKLPVYIKCTPQSDGSAIVNSTTPVVQTLPQTADGSIYIFIGIAYYNANSQTMVELMLEKPVYYHNGTGIRVWTGSTIPTKTSDLTNDSGFITSSDLPTNHVTTNTAQSITASKTFTGTSSIKFGTNEGASIYGNTYDSVLTIESTADTGSVELGNQSAILTLDPNYLRLDFSNSSEYNHPFSVQKYENGHSGSRIFFDTDYLYLQNGTAIYFDYNYSSAASLQRVASRVITVDNDQVTIPDLRLRLVNQDSRFTIVSSWDDVAYFDKNGLTFSNGTSIEFDYNYLAASFITQSLRTETNNNVTLTIPDLNLYTSRQTSRIIFSSGSLASPVAYFDYNGLTFESGKTISDGTHTYSLPSSSGTLALTSDIASSIFCTAQSGQSTSVSAANDYRPTRSGDFFDNPKFKGNGISLAVTQYVNLTDNTRLSVYVPDKTYVGSIAFPIASQSNTYAAYPVYFRGHGSEHNATVPDGSVLRLTFKQNAFDVDFYDLADFGVEHEPIVRVGKLIHQSSDETEYNGTLVGIRKDNGKADKLITVDVIDSSGAPYVTESLLDVESSSPVYVSFNCECFAAHPRVPFGFITNVEYIYDDFGISAIEYEYLKFYYVVNGSIVYTASTIQSHIVTNPKNNLRYFHIDNAPVYLITAGATGKYIAIGGIPSYYSGKLIGFLCSGNGNAGLIRLVDTRFTDYAKNSHNVVYSESSTDTVLSASSSNTLSAKHITPYSANTYDIGTNYTRWDDVYANRFNGIPVIAYAESTVSAATTSKTLSSKSNFPSTLKTGDIICIYFTNSNTSTTTPTISDGTNTFTLYRTNSVTVGNTLETSWPAQSYNLFRINGSKAVMIITNTYPTSTASGTTNIIPSSNNTYTLGSSTYKWSQLHSENIYAYRVYFHNSGDTSYSDSLPYLSYYSGRIESGSNIYPWNDNTYSLGTSGQAWKSVFAKNVYGGLFAECDTDAATQIKDITLDFAVTPFAGLRISVKFAKTNTATSPQLRINSSSTTYPIVYRGTSAVSNSSNYYRWQANDTIDLVFDGTSFVMAGWQQYASSASTSSYASYIGTSSTNYVATYSYTSATNRCLRPRVDYSSTAFVDLGSTAYKWGTLYCNAIGDSSNKITDLYVTNINGSPYSGGSSSSSTYCLMWLVRSCRVQAQTLVYFPSISDGTYITLAAHKTSGTSTGLGGTLHHASLTPGSSNGHSTSQPSLSTNLIVTIGSTYSSGSFKCRSYVEEVQFYDQTASTQTTYLTYYTVNLIVAERIL